MDLSHLNEQNRPRMVNVGAKDITDRLALAAGTVFLTAPLIQRINDGKLKKGNVLSAAQVAGIMAAKDTSRIIPLCHPLPLTGVDITFIVNEETIDIFSAVSCTGKTGVEMEALTAVSAAALTIYDMLKSAGQAMSIGDISLLYKEGGKSGYLKKDSALGGTVKGLNLSEKKGTVKQPVGQGVFVVEGGLQGDAHFGPGKRQVSLLAEDSITGIEKKLGKKLPDGSFGENIIVSGLSLHTLPVGSLFKIGSAFFRLSQVGKVCHNGCEIQKLTGDCVMPREGIFCQVIRGGTVRPGDTVEVLKR